ncbi:hypothetical protein GQ54DRAFT_224899 [Martensiomyces pterosporus]|nr:hypothetical protein GQ54DRAFT_224899 [Martensiomyces pterosporus]
MPSPSRANSRAKRSARGKPVPAVAPFMRKRNGGGFAHSARSKARPEKSTACAAKRSTRKRSEERARSIGAQGKLPNTTGERYLDLRFVVGNKECQLWVHVADSTIVLPGLIQAARSVPHNLPRHICAAHRRL